MTDEINQDDVSVLVVGGGSIGRRHIGNLRGLGVQTIGLFDPNPTRRQGLESEHLVTSFGTLEEALETQAPGAVLVCTPPHLHVEIATRALESGAHVFIEKPISHTLDGVDDLIAMAERQGRVLQVGYNWRFNAGLHQVKAIVDSGILGRVMWARAETGQYLPDWRPQVDYRTNYTAQRAMGGGIILDGSHELDYITWLLGDVTQVYCAAGSLSDLEVDVEDTASIILNFASGCIGEVHLDFVQRARARNCKIVGTEGTVIWDHIAGSLATFNAKDDRWVVLSLDSDINAMYVAEIQAFLTCIETSGQPVVDAQSARNVLGVALAALTSARDSVAVPLRLPEDR